MNRSLVACVFLLPVCIYTGLCSCACALSEQLALSLSLSSLTHTHTHTHTRSCSFRMALQARVLVAPRDVWLCTALPTYLPGAWSKSVPAFTADLPISPLPETYIAGHMIPCVEPTYWCHIACCSHLFIHCIVVNLPFHTSSSSRLGRQKQLACFPLWHINLLV